MRLIRCEPFLVLQELHVVCLLGRHFTLRGLTGALSSCPRIVACTPARQAARELAHQPATQPARRQRPPWRTGRRSWTATRSSAGNAGPGSRAARRLKPAAARPGCLGAVAERGWLPTHHRRLRSKPENKVGGAAPTTRPSPRRTPGALCRPAAACDHLHTQCIVGCIPRPLLAAPPRRSALTARPRTPPGPPCPMASSSACPARASTAAWACTSAS